MGRQGLSVAFEAEVRSGAATYDLFYHKLAVGGAIMGGQSRFHNATPYDGFFCVEGLFCPVEMKSSKEHGSFPLPRLAPHQVDGLARAFRERACPFLFINMRYLPTAGAASRLSPDARTTKTAAGGRRETGITLKRCNRAWVLPWDRWIDLSDELGLIGRKSIPYTWFEDTLRFAPLPRLEGKRGFHTATWDLPAGIMAACRLAKAPQYQELYERMKARDWIRRLPRCRPLVQDLDAAVEAA